MTEELEVRISTALDKHFADWTRQELLELAHEDLLTYFGKSADPEEIEMLLGEYEL